MIDQPGHLKTYSYIGANSKYAQRWLDNRYRRNELGEGASLLEEHLLSLRCRTQLLKVFGHCLFIRLDCCSSHHFEKSPAEQPKKEN